MKRIDGEIVIGSPCSAERFSNAPSMCTRCWTKSPVPIMTAILERAMRTRTRERSQCYVCEEQGFCYRLNEAV